MRKGRKDGRMEWWNDGSSTSLITSFGDFMIIESWYEGALGSRTEIWQSSEICDEVVKLKLHYLSISFNGNHICLLHSVKWSQTRVKYVVCA
ncbi:MAG: hypothetical protein ABI723_17035 [Bacteroidia bacterium]